jgi:NADPH-dependent curcumin reductase
MAITNKQIRLVKIPQGLPKEDDFKLVEIALAAPVESQVLIQNLYLTLDPWMRLYMRGQDKSYRRQGEVDEVMPGGTIGHVIISRHPQYQKGDYVTTRLGWQQYGVSDGQDIIKLEPGEIPLSAYLGVLGGTGITAWYGLTQIARLKAGETVLVSGAAGAVGTVAAQIARLKGCKVIGIAGGPQKARRIVEELSLTACLDYKASHLSEQLQELAPEGIDVYFDNVGGQTLDTVLPLHNIYGRIILCGAISQYNSSGEKYPIRNLDVAVTKRLKLEGFIISDHLDIWPQAKAELAEWFGTGQLKSFETVTPGLENAPQAFIGMLQGYNFGKQLVKF